MFVCRGEVEGRGRTVIPGLEQKNAEGTSLCRSGGAEDSRIFRVTIIAGNLTSHPVKNGQKCRAPRLRESSKIIFK